jgi:hypothetical protein
MRRAIVASLLTALLTVLTAVVLPTAAIAAPTDCQNGEYCNDFSMQPLNGAGLDASAMISFHRHNPSGSVVTLDYITVSNRNTVPCEYKVVVRNPSSGAGRAGGPWACGERHTIGMFVTWAWIVEVWVYNSRTHDFTYHSLSIAHLCSVRCL